MLITEALAILAAGQALEDRSVEARECPGNR